MTTYLNVPFRDKADAKAKGARWDNEAKKWFVPIGRDLEPFTSWLPVDPTRLASQQLAGPNKGVTLSRLLAGVATAVEQAFRQGVWTTAEVVRVDGDPHVYLELAERDAAGSLVAKAKAIVWSRDVERVLGAFQIATGVRVAAGIKVLISARPEFSAQYGLTLHVDAIDPSYTLGDLEAKKRQIREQLKTEGLFDRNRSLATPWDFRALLVVSPPRAAGLGDFARDADRLQRHGLCEAVYTHSRFEGEGAPASIRETIEAALAAWPGQDLPDAIVIIRGGGAVNDLAWLNDYELARFVCLNTVPVLTGIGHERDNTILDEVAHQRFDTPSKVIAGIQALIVKRARESQAAFDEVAGLTLKQLRKAQGEADQLDSDIRRQALGTVTKARAAVEEGMAGVQRQAQRALHDASQTTLRALSNVRAGAGSGLATACIKASSLVMQIQADATRGIREARLGIDDTRREIEQGARNAVRWGAEAAEATFREVVAQGPEKTLGRGFAVVRVTTGQIVTSAAVAREAATVQVQFKDGSIEASVRRGKENL
ncbi:MAG: exodeoxyribonuclease VII large subunit [Methylibium sp.]|uniref:exodeoxyribonuclease VII large subunit n=1 Tax=Methylibium sp. TaxID=2067992 RepID=UPI00179D8A61|nr:exodeoxyribonuclease VII large subunit [Methylibium sp.]MBA3599358.1 exodeoxyribonuclease VII large subunit [Methylibium sp.]